MSISIGYHIREKVDENGFEQWYERSINTKWCVGWSEEERVIQKEVGMKKWVEFGDWLLPTKRKWVSENVLGMKKLREEEGKEKEVVWGAAKNIGELTVGWGREHAGFMARRMAVGKILKIEEEFEGEFNDLLREFMVSLELVNIRLTKRKEDTITTYKEMIMKSEPSKILEYIKDYMGPVFKVGENKSLGKSMFGVAKNFNEMKEKMLDTPKIIKKPEPKNEEEESDECWEDEMGNCIGNGDEMKNHQRKRIKMMLENGETSNFSTVEKTPNMKNNNLEEDYRSSHIRAKTIPYWEVDMTKKCEKCNNEVKGFWSRAKGGDLTVSLNDGCGDCNGKRPNELMGKDKCSSCKRYFIFPKCKCEIVKKEEAPLEECKCGLKLRNIKEHIRKGRCQIDRGLGGIIDYKKCDLCFKTFKKNNFSRHKCRFTKEGEYIDYLRCYMCGQLVNPDLQVHYCNLSLAGKKRTIDHKKMETCQYCNIVVRSKYIIKHKQYCKGFKLFVAALCARGSNYIFNKAFKMFKRKDKKHVQKIFTTSTQLQNWNSKETNDKIKSIVEAELKPIKMRRVMKFKKFMKREWTEDMEMEYQKYLIDRKSMVKYLVLSVNESYEKEMILLKHRAVVFKRDLKNNFMNIKKEVVKMRTVLTNFYCNKINCDTTTIINSFDPILNVSNHQDFVNFFNSHHLVKNLYLNLCKIITFKNNQQMYIAYKRFEIVNESNLKKLKIQFDNSRKDNDLKKKYEAAIINYESKKEDKIKELMCKKNQTIIKEKKNIKKLIKIQYQPSFTIPEIDEMITEDEEDIKDGIINYENLTNEDEIQEFIDNYLFDNIIEDESETRITNEEITGKTERIFEIEDKDIIRNLQSEFDNQIIEPNPEPQHDDDDSIIAPNSTKPVNIITRVIQSKNNFCDLINQNETTDIKVFYFFFIFSFLDKRETLMTQTIKRI